MTKRQVARVRFIRQRRTYTVRELAELVGVHPRTVHQWHTEGLTALEGSHPLLFMGSTARGFLRARVAGRKHKLGPGEFYCMRCKQPRLSHRDSLNPRPSGKRIGKGKELVLLYGSCRVCGCRMVRFTFRPVPKKGSFSVDGQSS